MVEIAIRKIPEIKKPIIPEPVRQKLNEWTQKGRDWLDQLKIKADVKPKEVLKEVSEAPTHTEKLLKPSYDKSKSNEVNLITKPLSAKILRRVITDTLGQQGASSLPSREKRTLITLKDFNDQQLEDFYNAFIRLQNTLPPDYSWRRGDPPINNNAIQPPPTEITT